MAKIVFFIIFYCSPLFLFSQNPDSIAITKRIDYLLKEAPDLWYLGKKEDAIDTIQKAREIANHFFGESNSQYALILYRIGCIHFALENDSLAEIHYLSSIDIWASKLRIENEDYSNALTDLGNFYLIYGMFDQAKQPLTKAKDIRKEILGIEHSKYALSLINLATCYSELGQYKDAEELYEDAKSILVKKPVNSDSTYLLCLIKFASFYYGIGGHAKAERLLEEAKIICENLSDTVRWEYATSLNGLAILAQEKGQFGKAEQFYLTAKNIYERINGDKSRYADVLNNLATLYGETGQFSQAETYILRAKEIYASVLNIKSPPYAVALNNVAVLYKKMKRVFEADSLYQEAENILRNSYGKGSKKYASALLNRANLYEENKQYDEAELLYQEAKTIFEDSIGLDGADYGTVLSGLAIVYQAKHQYAQAELFYAKAKDIYLNTLGDSHQDYADFLINLSTFYWQTHLDSAVISNMTKAFSIQHELLIKGAQYLSEYELLQYYKTFIEYQDRLYSFTQNTEDPSGKIAGLCFDNSLFYNGFLLNAINQLKRIALSDTNTSKIFTTRTDFQRSLAQAYILEQDSNYTAYLEEKTNTLGKELAHIPGYDKALKQVSWREVQQNLKPGDVAIQFIRYRKYNPNPTDSFFYSVLVLRYEDAFPHFINLFEELSLKTLMQGLASDANEKISQLYEFRNGGKGEQLYDLIWKPLEDQLKNSKTIYCSLAGELYRLNLGAIPIDSFNVFSNIHQLVTLGNLRQLILSLQLSSTKKNNKAYVAGGIRYKSNVLSLDGDIRDAHVMPQPDLLEHATRNKTWEYLPHTLGEVLDINKILRKANYTSQLDTGYNASEESFKKLGAKGPSPRIIHISSHGYFSAIESYHKDLPIFQSSPHPLIRSGVLFAGAQQAWSTGKAPKDREDGVLTAYEISQLDLSNTELVVLSACETGLGDIEINEGVYGLQRAFKIAGAKYLIMSLWNVNDATTRRFMTEFYSEWAGHEKDLSIPEAFRLAQQKMQARYSGPNLSYLWAGFVLIE